MNIGLSYEEAQTLPLSLLLDLISVEQIKREGCRYRKPMSQAEEWNELFKLR